MSVELKSVRCLSGLQARIDRPSLIWNELEVNYTRAVLAGISGRVFTGEMVGILGRSGSGKSTLLNCLAGLTQPTKGKIGIETSQKDLTLSLVTQSNDLCDYLTVREYITFSAKLKYKYDVKLRVVEVIQSLNLTQCSENLTSKCSGGERKRTALAVEIVSKPNILLVDEPTSGLDSYTAYRTALALKNLVVDTNTNNQAMVIASIHQPSSDVLDLFDRIYVLCKGKYLYVGHPRKVKDALSAANIQLLPYSNPSESLMNLAAGLYEQDRQKVLLAAHSEHDTCVDMACTREVVNLKRRTSFARMWWLILQNLAYATMRDPHQCFGRLLLCIALPLFYKLCQKEVVFSACLYDVQNSVVMHESVSERADRQRFVTSSIFSIVYNTFTAYFTATVTTFLSTSCQLRATMAENRNNWYSIGPFFLAWTTTNVIITLTTSAACILFFFMGSKLIHDLNMLWLLTLLMFLPSLSTSLLGFITGVFFHDRKLVGLIVSSIILMGMMIACGFFIKVDLMIKPLLWMSTVNPNRLGLESTVATVYSSSCSLQANDSLSFDQVLEFTKLYNFQTKSELSIIRPASMKLYERLSEYPWTPDGIVQFLTANNDLQTLEIEKLVNFMNTRFNFVLNEYNVSPNDVPANLCYLLLISIVLHVVAYFALLIKARFNF